MSVEVFHGTWKILECVNISSSRDSIPAKIDGAVFVLQENGEIRWDLSSEVDKGFPLFQCDCYEVVHTFVGVCIQMGAVSGHMFEFWVDRPVPRDMMLLTFEGWCMIQCQQINAIQPPLDFPFSFLPAFTEGYFSDLELPLPDADDAEVEGLLGDQKSVGVSTIGCKSGDSSTKEFKVHTVIMDLSNSKPEELTKLTPDVMEIVLHFLYSQRLPPNLTSDAACRCIQLAPKSMSDFVQMCKDYVHRVSLKQKIVKLVNEVHSCAEAMSSAFREHSVISPSRFCFVIKLALRDAAVAFMKLVELCVLYGEEAPVLTRTERLEILRYAKTRLPIFLTQFVALLRNVKNDFSTVKPADRNDIAAHVAPEIETLLESLSNLMREARDACNEIWAQWSFQHGTNSSGPGGWQEGNNRNTGSNSSSGPTGHSGIPIHSGSMDSLTEALYGIFRKREIVKLHHVQGQVAAIYLYLAQKKENFEEMTTAVKIRCVSRNLEQLLEELPVFLLRLEEIMIAFDDRFQWKDFKFCLQLAISQVCQTVQHLRRERNQLQKFFICLSELVQRDEFHQSLVNLGLLEVPTETDSSSTPETCPDSGISSASGSSSHSSFTSELAGHQFYKPTGNEYHASFGNTSGMTSSNLGFQANTEHSELNLVENLCTSKKAKDNILARNAVKLFDSKDNSDMVFEIPQDGDKLEIPAHRVIVAARCDWFRRALLSGMKESIQKRIVIHDCSVQVFQLFLRFVYTGQIGTELTLETLSDLIALADRYELDILKLYCEQELAVRHLDETSVIFLLSFSDQFNARTLRGATMEYIAANPGIMAKELFEELSPELQMEVYDITMWSKPKKVFSIPDELLSCPRYMLVPDSPSEDEDSSSGSSSPTVGRRHHTHRHHHTHTHVSSNSAASGGSIGMGGASGINPFTDTSSTSFSVQQAIANSIAEHQSRRGFAFTEEASINLQEHQENRSNEERLEMFVASRAGPGGQVRNSSGWRPRTDLTQPANPAFSSERHQVASDDNRDANAESNTSSDNDTVLNNIEFQRCIRQLKDVLGEDISDEQLGRIAIAADFDVNRALNFFFSS